MRSSTPKREDASRKGRDTRPAKRGAVAPAPRTSPASTRPAPGRRRTIPALASVAALLLAVGLGAYLLRAGRRSDAGRATPATRALPESEAERVLLASGNGRGAPEALGRYYLEAGRPFAAVWQFQEALSVTAAASEEQRAPITLELAQALQQGRWFALAARLLEPIAAASPGNIAVRQHLAGLYLATGRPQAAVRLLASGVGNRFEDVPLTASVPRVPRELLLRFGEACEAAGLSTAARAAYERAAREVPGDPEPLLHVGRLLLDEGDPAKAVVRFRRAAALRPTEPRFAVHLGRALMRLGGRANREDAGRRLDAAASVAPGSAPARMQLGLFHQQERRWREAGHAYLAALELDPQNAEAHRRLGELMAALGEPVRAHYHRGWAFVLDDRPQDAVAEFRAMAAADPASVEAPLLISQGYVQMVQDQDDRAVEVVREALARHPREPRLYGRLASLYFINHDRRAAAELCDEWRRFQPEAAEPIWMQGRLAVADHQLDEGIRLLAQAAAKEPDRAEYEFDLGEALARRPSAENLRRALEALGRAVSLAPNTPRYHYQLAVVLQRLGELEGARRQLLRVLDQDPTSVPAISSLTQVSQALGRPAQARFWAAMVPEIEESLREETDLRRRLGRQPDDAGDEVALARLLIDRGDLARARGHLVRALQLRPHSPEIRAQHATIERLIAMLAS